MTSRLGSIVAFAAFAMEGINDYQSDWKDRIAKQWEESKKMPRKKKKRVRKKLLMDWQIANYNPFFSGNNFMGEFHNNIDGDAAV